MLLQHFVAYGQSFERQILNFKDYQCEKNEVNEECYSEYGAYFMSCHVTCLIFLYIHLHFQHVEAISYGNSKVLAFHLSATCSSLPFPSPCLDSVNSGLLAGISVCP